MKTASNLLVLLFLLILCWGCTDSNDNKKSKKTAFELSQNLWQDYRTDLKQGNPIDIGQNFTNDARIVYPNSPEIAGRESIDQAIKAMFPRIKILEFKFIIEDCFVRDSLLFNYITVNEKYMIDGIENISFARISSLWKLNSENVWKVSLFHVNYKNLD